MRIKRKKSPEQATDGPHFATLADVEDLGNQVTAFGEKHNLRLVFVLDEYDQADHPILVSLIATASAHEDSKLTSIVRVLLGNEASEDFETEDLIGRSCWLKTKQQLSSKGKLFAQIVNIRALKPGESGPAIPVDFVRGANRPNRKRSDKTNGATKPFTNMHSGVTVMDEDVAFPEQHN